MLPLLTATQTFFREGQFLALRGQKLSALMSSQEQQDAVSKTVHPAVRPAAIAIADDGRALVLLVGLLLLGSLVLISPGAVWP
ncbi:MAG: hypothetical protein R3C16_01625 [Hyphomonadaceae bacterium]